MTFVVDPQLLLSQGETAPTDCQIGHGSIIGYGEGKRAPVLGPGVSIGAFCVVHWDSEIGEGVTIDHYCRIGAGARVGAATRVLYGSQLFDDCVIGERCIVGGDVSDRVVMEDDVTFMGEIAHSHRDPTLDWDTTQEPSPVFKRGCVVGVGALILGGVTIGKGAYVGAREVIRTDVPPRTVVINGQRSRLEQWRGFIKTRL